MYEVSNLEDRRVKPAASFIVLKNKKRTYRCDSEGENLLC